MNAPPDCDLLIFGCLELRDLLAVRSCSRALRARYAPHARQLSWRAVRPADLRPLARSPLATIVLLHTAYGFTPAEIGKWDILHRVCKGGDVEVAEWLVATYELDVVDRGVLLFSAGSRGHLRMVQWLVRHYDISQRGSYVDILRTFRGACDDGHLPVVQWLAAYFEISRTDVYKADDSFSNCPFIHACIGGHLQLMQWIAHYFDLTEAEARSDGEDYALSWACHNGHWQVVEWLLTHYSITAGSLNIDLGLIVRTACMRGYLLVVQRLTTHFGLTAADFTKGGALRWACVRGHVPVVEWLAAHFNLVAKDLRADDILWVTASRPDSGAMMEWLGTHFEFSREELQRAAAAAAGNVGASLWLEAQTR